MKICLAGGAGFIGTELATKLVELGHEVVIIDLFMFGDYLPLGVGVVRADLWDCISEEFAGYECVVFLAGVSNDPMAEFSPAENFKDNAGLPSFIAHLCKQAGVPRFIYASTCSVYGFSDNNLMTEEDNLAPHFPYGLSKLIGEKGCLQQADEKFNVIALRKGTVCGASGRMRFDLVVNTMVKTAINEGVIRVHNPKLWRPILDIRDAIDAYLQAIFTEHIGSGAYNIASENIQIGELGGAVMDIVYDNMCPSVKFDVQHKKDLRNYKVSCNKAMMEFSYCPERTIKDTAFSVLEWCLVHKPDFKDDKFYNINMLKKWLKK